MQPSTWKRPEHLVFAVRRGSIIIAGTKVPTVRTWKKSTLFDTPGRRDRMEEGEGGQGVETSDVLAISLSYVRFLCRVG